MAISETSAELRSEPITKRRVPPGPPGMFPLLRLCRQKGSFLEALKALTLDYGDISLLRFGPRRAYFLNHPDLIRELLLNKRKSFKKGYVFQRVKLLLGNGLLTSDGDFHLRQRRLMQPIFQRERIKSFIPLMAESVEQITREWKSGERRDINVSMMHLTLTILVRAIFRTNLQRVETITDAVVAGSEVFAAVGWIPFVEYFEFLPLPVIRRYKAARRQLNDFLYELIAERRATPRTSDGPLDIVGMLIDAQDEEAGGVRMSDQQIRDELITLILAGHETMASGLTWAWCLLSQHPECQARLQQEADAVLEDRSPGLDDLPRLKYATAVFAEALRLYPSIYAFGRTAIEEVEIGGYVIPKGSGVTVVQYGLHRHPRYWTDPDEFRPERWLDEDPTRPRPAYLPFGTGVRQCIGEPMAWIEGPLVLASIARRWNLRLDPEHVVVPSPSVTLRPRKGMPMFLEARHS